MEWYGAPIRIKSTGPGNQIVVYAYQICSVIHNDHHKSIIIALLQRTLSQRISFPLGFSTICALVPVKMWRNAETGTRVTFLVFTALLLFALCVYLNTAIVNHHNMGSGGQTQRRKLRLLVYICVICNRLSNPCSNPAHNTDCGALKKLSSCGQEIICTCIICLKNGAKKPGSGLFLPG